MEIRDLDNWPGSVTDPNAPRERAKLVGDIVMEVRPDGSEVNEWRLLACSILTASPMAAVRLTGFSAAIPTRTTGATPTGLLTTCATIQSWCRCGRRTAS